MIGIFIALLSGALMSVQGVFNTEVTKGTSMWVSNSWVQFSALVICLVGWFYRSDKLCGDSAGTAQIHAAGRRNRGVYYLHGD